MPIRVYPERMEYLSRMLEELPSTSDPAKLRTTLRIETEWIEGNLARTRLGDVELLADERAQSTGSGAAPSPAHYFLAGFGFAFVTQWGRASAVLGVPIESLEQEVRAWFDRRGEYLYELGWPHNGFEEITFFVRITSTATRSQVREFVSWADRSPPLATLRRAVRLVGVFTLNGEHLTTAIYHPDRTEYR
jgi:uncharacterized OsmC-like protein